MAIFHNCTKLLAASAAAQRSSLQSLQHLVRRQQHQTTSFSIRHQSSTTSPPIPMRFIQFQRNGKSDAAAASRLGLLSDDGKRMVDLTAQCPHLTDLLGFISAGEAVVQRLQAKLPEFKWQPLGNDIELLAPVSNPDKIICIGLNYAGHCREQNKSPPTEPMFFSKFNNTLTGPTGNVISHRATSEIDWEVELAVIIGKEARHVPLAKAMDHVFGYSVAQDISARDWQKQRNGGQFLIGKSMDTFCPLGPAVVHKSLVKDPHQLRIQCAINGVPKQDGNTSELIFRIDQIVHMLSETITLKPGDVILTGTPGGVGMHRKPAEFLKVGDLIESEIESIGKIANRVVADRD